MPPVQPSVYSYREYRTWLRDWFQRQKTLNPRFSHQAFANKAGVKSSGFLLHVMKGERNLTPSVLLKVARAIGLQEEETEFFEDMVAFDQAKSHSEKDHFYKRILAKKQSVDVRAVEDYQYEFYSKWYHSVLRELVTLVPDGDVARLAALLSPKVPPGEVKRSLELQEKLGFLKKSGGKYIQAEPFLTAGGAARPTALVNYQKQSLGLALEAWDRHPAGEMSMNTLTLCMPEAMVETIRREFRLFKKRVYKLIAAEKADSERVYQVNFNMFPVSEKRRGDAR